MRLALFLLLTLLLLIFFSSCNDAQNERLEIANEIEKSIETDLLNKWYPAVIDSAHGGYLSTFTHDFKPTGDQDKMIVTQARHMWTSAKAAEHYPNISSIKKVLNMDFGF